MNLEKIAEEIKLELHDKHMMYIDGEDSVTHRLCKQIIWRVIKKHFSKHLNETLSFASRSELNDHIQDILGRNVTDEEWERVKGEIHQVDRYFDEPFEHMIDVVSDIKAESEVLNA
jgi:hypothetical protein